MKVATLSLKSPGLCGQGSERIQGLRGLGWALRARVQKVGETARDADTLRVAGGGSAVITTTQGWEEERGEEKKTEKKTEGEREKTEQRGGEGARRVRELKSAT
jgi:hypothetical protein